jgi:hypothetical protein
VETPSPIDRPNPEDYEVFQLDMVDELQGWAILSIGRPPDDKYWISNTSDGARTWDNTKPPTFEAIQAGVAFPISPSLLKVDILDSDTTWAYT